MKKEYDFSKGRKGKKVKEIKVVKTFRLDPDIVEWLEEQGQREKMDYQTFLNWFLRKTIISERSLEDRLEELEKFVMKKFL